MGKCIVKTEVFAEHNESFEFEQKVILSRSNCEVYTSVGAFVTLKVRVRDRKTRSMRKHQEIEL